MNETSNKYLTFCIYLVLALSTVAVYWQLRHNDFVDFDDDLYITDNAYVKAGLTQKGVVWAFTTTQAYNWHPLTWLSHMLDCELHGLNPGRHHLSNLLLHIVNTLLLFAVLKRMTGALWRSAFVAAAFALHPLHVESVAWASERKDVLSSFFWILTVALYVRYAERPSIERYLAVALVFGLGLMAKQMLVTLPFVLLLLDYWPLRRFTLEKKPLGRIFVSAPCRRCILEKVPLLILSIIAGFIVYTVQQKARLVGSFVQYPLTERITNAATAYTAYIGKMLWPARLAIFYPHPEGTLSVLQIGGASFLLTSITVAAFRKMRKHPYIVVGWMWYLATLVPVIGLVQVGGQSMADRYSYMPLTGLFIIIAWAAFELVSRLRYRKAILSAVAAIVLMFLAVTARQQTKHWLNSAALYGHAAEAVQNNWWAYEHLGVALANQGSFDEGLKHIKTALDMKPDSAETLTNLGDVLFKKGELDESIISLRSALRIKPDYYLAHNNIGAVLGAQGRLDEAIEHLIKAIQLKPDCYKAHLNLGLAFAQRGDFDKAVIHFTAALQIKPDLDMARRGLADAQKDLGDAFVQSGNVLQAIIHYSEALRIRPDFAEVHHNVGYALACSGRFDEAVSHYTEALRLKPDLAATHYSLGVALSRQGRLDEAIKHYLDALRIKPDFENARRELSVALAQRDGTSESNKPNTKGLPE